MKKISLFIIAALAVSCGYQSKKIDEISYCDIDTIVIKETHFEKIRFELEESYYPQIKNKRNSVFLNKINDTLKNNFDSFLDNAQKDAEAFVKDKQNDGFPAGSIIIYFDVFSTDTIVSVIQYASISGEGGGCNWYTLHTVINIDLKNEKILRTTDFGMTENKINFINKRIDDYCRNNNYDEGIGEYILEDKKDFQESQFLIRNDSVMLARWLAFFGGAHVGSGVYIIPIEKWDKIK